MGEPGVLEFAGWSKRTASAAYRGASVLGLDGGPEGPRKSSSVGNRPFWIALMTAGNEPPQNAATGITDHANQHHQSTKSGNRG